MIVLLAGMPRSGSTFAFNVVREVLRVRGSLYQEACEDIAGAVHRSGGTDHVVVKAHHFDTASVELARAGAARIVMTVRRVEDAMASWFEAFDAVPEAVAIQVMRDWLRLFQALHGTAVIVPYATIDRRPWLAVWRIARAICPAVGPAEVIGIARRFSKAAVKRQVDGLALDAPGVTAIGFSHYDATTFFHRRHVAALDSRPAEQRLDAARLARVRAALADEIRAAGLEHDRLRLT